MSEVTGGSARRRAPNACVRCRSHKIKCSGTQPCNTCARRRQTCHFSDRLKFSQSYVEELQRRVAASEQAEQHPDRPSARNESIEYQTDVHGATGPDLPGDQLRGRLMSVQSQDMASDSSHVIINDMATGQTAYLPDTTGRSIYLGTSSSWSFGRRVLLLAQERVIKAPLSPNHLLWEGRAYDLGWNGCRGQSISSDIGSAVIPEADFGMFLINAVKFHIGQLFHLFDETDFMDNFAKFYDRKDDLASSDSLWYKHYLLILAFGKAFTARNKTAGRRPPGCGYFTKAMSSLPDFNLGFYDPFESIEILCCAALYLHSLDFRGAAYNVIGQALRTALQNGYHTDMTTSNMSERKLERARKIWWTVLLLDRQMSSLMGLPPAIGDDHINAGLPDYDGSTSKAQALDLHIRLSSVMFSIVSNVYGKEGRINSRFLVHTKAALQGVANATNELNQKFSLPLNKESAGLSRVSAYLHIFQHQCIVMATRPLLYSYFDARLSDVQHAARAVRLSSSIKTLMRMCKDSAVHMLQILASLQKQGLMESFLPFDADATYNSAIVLQMATHIDAPLLGDHTSLLDIAYACFDEMISCGNRSAEMMKLEVQRLHDILGRSAQQQNLFSAFQQSANTMLTPDRTSHSRHGTISDLTDPTSLATSTHLSDETTYQFGGSVPLLQDGLDAEEMMMVANAIDLDGIDWWFNRADQTDIGVE